MATVHWASGKNSYELAGAEFETDAIGITVVTERYVCRDDAACADALDFDADDCVIPLTNPKIVSADAKRMEGLTWEVTRKFSGLTSTDKIDDETNRKYTGSTVVNTEQIETHPRFNSFATEANGAVFDEEELFVRFDQLTGSGQENPKAGTDSYYVPATTLTERKLIRQAYIDEEAERMNRIEVPPATPVRPNYANRNWLVTAVDFNEVGSEVWEVNTTWTCSGPRGWDTDIYPS